MPLIQPQYHKKRMLTYHMQLTSELQTQGLHITPRQAFITDLSELLQHFRCDNHHMILCGNFNEAITLTSDRMSKIMSNFHLVNITYHLIGHDNFATYHRDNTNQLHPL